MTFETYHPIDGLTASELGKAIGYAMRANTLTGIASLINNSEYALIKLGCYLGGNHVAVHRVDANGDLIPGRLALITL